MEIEMIHALLFTFFENHKSELFRFCSKGRRRKGGQLVAFPREVIVFCN